MGDNPYADATDDFAAVDDTADASDYTGSSGISSRTFIIPVVDDKVDEGCGETVLLTLSNPAGAALDNPSSTSLTIVDDD